MVFCFRSARHRAIYHCRTLSHLSVFQLTGAYNPIANEKGRENIINNAAAFQQVRRCLLSHSMKVAKCCEVPSDGHFALGLAHRKKQQENGQHERRDCRKYLKESADMIGHITCQHWTDHSRSGDQV